jgi:hypothetical protein
MAKLKILAGDKLETSSSNNSFSKRFKSFRRKKTPLQSRHVISSYKRHLEPEWIEKKENGRIILSKKVDAGILELMPSSSDTFLEIPFLKYLSKIGKKELHEVNAHTNEG